MVWESAPEKLFPLYLIQLGSNVIHCSLNSWNNNCEKTNASHYFSFQLSPILYTMLNSINSSISHLDHLIQSYKRCLLAGNITSKPSTQQAPKIYSLAKMLAPQEAAQLCQTLPCTFQLAALPETSPPWHSLRVWTGKKIIETCFLKIVQQTYCQSHQHRSQRPAEWHLWRNETSIKTLWSLFIESLCWPATLSFFILSLISALSTFCNTIWLHDKKINTTGTSLTQFSQTWSRQLQNLPRQERKWLPS